MGRDRTGRERPTMGCQRVAAPANSGRRFLEGTRPARIDAKPGRVRRTQRSLDRMMTHGIPGPVQTGKRPAEPLTQRQAAVSESSGTSAIKQSSNQATSARKYFGKCLRAVGESSMTRHAACRSSSRQREGGADPDSPVMTADGREWCPQGTVPARRPRPGLPSWCSVQFSRSGGGGPSPSAPVRLRGGPSRGRAIPPGPRSRLCFNCAL